MKEIKYQQKAVRKLVDETIDLLRFSGHRKTLIFKAPTGSGKTVMASLLLADLAEELQSRGDSPYQQVAFVWIAPNKLHQQSYFKMKNYFAETRMLKPVMYDEIDQSEGVIKPGEILFVNWESINKEKNVMVRDSEQNVSLYEIIRRTQEEQGLPIIVVIDEEHLFWSKSADKSAKVLQKINPKVEIRISATPKTGSDHIVTVSREEVVSEEMIKKQVVLNPDITKGYNKENELNIHLVQCALEKRKLLSEVYMKEGTNINPLLLIQLPNDTSESMTSEDSAIAEQVKTYLRAIEDITVENKKLAVWLSGEKENLDGLEQPDSLTEVLLFKQAIALGWDCPRAAVLLIFRKLQSNQFTIQTVGRILRMPEQHFYKNDLLNVGYVYTDISKDQIQIVAEDMDYLNKDALQAIRRGNLKNVALTSYYSVYKSSDRNRLGPDFKKELIDSFTRNWLVKWQQLIFSFSHPNDLALTGEENSQSPAQENRKMVEQNQHIKFDVSRLGVEVPEDIVFQNELGVIDVERHKHEFAKSVGEVHRIYTNYCRSLLSSFEKAHSTDVLAGYLLQAMEELFELFETDAMKVILYHASKPKFTDIITKALANYERKLQERQRQAKERAFEQYTWEVPAERLYKENTHHVVPQVAEHALMPFIELNTVSTPERRFSEFLEDNKAYVEWWYKNGDEGKQHYSIPYVNSQGEKALFYVDFVIKMKNGQVFLFDTKTENCDSEAPYKHNALIDYMDGKGLQGGVIVEKNNVWHYSRFHIDTTEDVTGWEAFFPDKYV
ncbi:MAG: DEAD/DEAH box helicase family protein [Bacteroidaceae bacterium]|nr:DEAD/DEAH box helicase family protein [Bacteroidaceae bacterium]